MNIPFSYSPAPHRIRDVLCAACLLLCLAFPLGQANAASEAVPAPTEKLALPPEVEQALNEALKAAVSQTNPQQSSLDAIAAFCLASGSGTGSRILPERPEGAGVFYYRALPFSLTTLMAYALNPSVPGEALYPNSVRRNFWHKDSPILTEWKALAQCTLPPATTVFSRGVEFEEITPDENSGSYYAYDLQRLFALTALPDKKGTALFMVSVQPAPSKIGLKGAVVGQDLHWNYVYTGAQGSTLPMVGWAETHIYNAITVNVWVDVSGKLTLYTFKWLKAGWSGMNVVKTEHINAGISRYLLGLIQVMGSDQRPKVSAIAARFKELKAMSDEQLIDELKLYGEQLALLAKEQSLEGGDFVKVLKDGCYSKSLKRDDRISELIKLYMKQQLGMIMPSPSS